MKRTQILNEFTSRKKTKTVINQSDLVKILLLPIDIYREIFVYFLLHDLKQLRISCKLLKELLDNNFLFLLPRLSIQDTDELQEQISKTIKNLSTRENLIGFNLDRSWIDYRVVKEIPQDILILSLSGCAIEVKKPQGYAISKAEIANLRSRSFMKTIESIPKNIRELNLGNFFIPSQTLPSNFIKSLPTTLTSLNIRGISVSAQFKYLSTNLTYLNACVGTTEDFHPFPNLKVLHCQLNADCFSDSIESTNIEEIKVEIPKRHIEKEHWPRKLRNLEISGGIFNGAVLNEPPSTLSKLSLLDIHCLSTLHFPTQLIELSVHISSKYLYDRVFDFSDHVTSLKKLSIKIDYHIYESVLGKLPSCLRNLHFQDVSIYIADRYEKYLDSQFHPNCTLSGVLKLLRNGVTYVLEGKKGLLLQSELHL